MAAGFTTGAVLGGLLTDVLSWRWAFFINVAVAAVVLAVAPACSRESRAASAGRGSTCRGALTVTARRCSALVYGLTTAGDVAAAPIRVAMRRAARRLPCSPPSSPSSARVASRSCRSRVLRRRTVACGNLAGLLAFATETGLVFLLTLYLQDVLGYSPLARGRWRSPCSARARCSAGCSGRA